MGMFDWIVFDQGKARMCGSQRDAGVGSREVFAIEIHQRPAYYGEFEINYLDDRTNYNIEIVSFGYGDRLGVGLPAPSARAAFSNEEIEAIKLTTIELMAGAQPKPFPIHESTYFTGTILFRDGWVRRE